MSKKVKLSPPWFTYAAKLEALFGQDPDIHINVDEDTPAVRFYIDDDEKVKAFNAFFPPVIHFGNVDLKIEIIPANKDNKEDDPRELLGAMFAGNPVLNYIQDVTGVFPNPIHYFVMKKEVVQVWKDDLSDAHGVESTLYEILCREILGEHDGIFFCTDIDDSSEDEEYDICSDCYNPGACDKCDYRKDKGESKE